jgi:C-terminal processing protease CtpA/Prc
VENGLGKELAEAIRKLATTNRLEGLVVDLRYAAGRDLSAAGAAADPFISEERKLLDWDNGSASSTAKTNAFAEPVAVLVNARTAGAAEALAAILRQAQVGLLLGAPTAGQAAVQKEFDLGAGYRLRLAVAQLRLADGQAIPLNGLTPDIQVKVSPEDEPQYYADAYKVIARAGPALAAVSPGQAGSATNRPARLTEADLVRMKREGLDPNVDTPPPRKPAAPDKPVVTDPTLLRALDLLKGLAVVREAGRR